MPLIFRPWLVMERQKTKNRSEFPELHGSGIQALISAYSPVSRSAPLGTQDSPISGGGLHIGRL